MDKFTINRTTDLTALVPGLRRHGRYYIGPCPFCGGDDRFTVKRTEAGDLWICRRCGDGKYHDAVAFRMRAEGKTFAEVTSDATDERRNTKYEIRGEQVAARADGSELVSRLSHFVSPPDEAWQIARLEVQQRLADNLWITDVDREVAPDVTRAVWHYLRAHRGLERDTIRRAMIGYNLDWFRARDGVNHPPGLHIPCMVGGRLWNVKVRLPRAARETGGRRGGRLPKYMAVRGSQEALFNGDALLGARGAVVVEGEFDALLLGQFLPEGWAAVTMGSAGLLPGPAFLPYFSGVERLLLCLDNDPAGQASLAAWRGLLGRAEPAPPLPAGVKDVTDFWRAGGDLRQWLKL